MAFYFAPNPAPFLFSRTVANPANQVDSDYNLFMSTLREQVDQQKQEVKARLVRMDDQKQYSEAARVQRIIDTPVADREPVYGERAGRRLGWLEEIDKTRPGRAGDTILQAPEADDPRKEHMLLNQRELMELSINNKATGTSRNRADQKVEGSDNWASARQAGVLYPVFAREPFQDVNQPSIDLELGAANRSTVTAAAWRGNREAALPRRSQDVQMNTTSGPNHVRGNGKTAQAVQPSFVLRDDGTVQPMNPGTGHHVKKAGVREAAASYVLRNDGTLQPVIPGTGHHIKKPIREDAVVVTGDDSSMALGLPANFTELKGEQGAERDYDQFKFREAPDLVQDRLSVRSDLAALKQPGFLGTELPYSLNDDSRFSDPAQRASTDVMQAQPIYKDSNVHAKPDSAYTVALGGDSRVSTQPGAFVAPSFKLVQDALGSGKVYAKALGTGLMVEPCSDRLAATAERVTQPRDIVNLAAQNRHLGAKLPGHQGGTDMVANDLSNSKRTTAFDADNAMSLAQRSEHTAAPERGEVTHLREAPDAAREPMRVQGGFSYQSERPDVTFRGPNTTALQVDVMQRGGVDTATVIGRPVLGVSTSRGDHVTADEEDVARGVRTMTVRELLEKQAMEHGTTLTAAFPY